MIRNLVADIRVECLPSELLGPKFVKYKIYLRAHNYHTHIHGIPAGGRVAACTQTQAMDILSNAKKEESGRIKTAAANHSVNCK